MAARCVRSQYPGPICTPRGLPCRKPWFSSQWFHLRSGPRGLRHADGRGGSISLSQSRGRSLMLCGDVVGRAGRDAVWRACRACVTSCARFVVVKWRERGARRSASPTKSAPSLCQRRRRDHHRQPCLDRREIMAYIAGDPRLLRPINYRRCSPAAASASTVWPTDAACWCERHGAVFMDAIDESLRRDRPASWASIGSATSPRSCWFPRRGHVGEEFDGPICDGRASAVIGTHSHVRPRTTAPAEGHAYMTDVGSARTRFRDRHAQGRRHWPSSPSCRGERLEGRRGRGDRSAPSSSRPTTPPASPAPWRRSAWAASSPPLPDLPAPRRRRNNCQGDCFVASLLAMTTPSLRRSGNLCRVAAMLTRSPRSFLFGWSCVTGEPINWRRPRRALARAS